MRGLQGQPAVVTGAASGIGRAIALALGQHGARVALLDIEDATAVAADVRAEGGEAAWFATDVRHREAVDVAAAGVATTFGPASLLVNCAGGFRRKASLLAMTEEEWHGVLDLNLTAAFHTLRAFGPAMVRQRRGSIVNIASTAATMVWPGQGHYGVAKAGLVALTRSAALELGRTGVRVNSVSPSTVATPGVAPVLADPLFRANEEQATALGRLATPEDVARVVIFLLSDDSGYLTGIDVLCDGGYALTGQKHLGAERFLS